jgi:hypothetical protein
VKIRATVLLLMVMFCVSACGVYAESPTPDMHALQTVAAGTISAMETAIEATIEAQATATFTPNQTLSQTGTPSPTSTLTPTLLPFTVSPLTCNKAAFVLDVGVPDDVNLAPSVTFTKTWRLRNVGSCTWNGNYSMVLVGGEPFSAPTPVSLPKIVAPGDTADVSIVMKTPSSMGTYQGYWMIQDASGNKFGIGANADTPMWVRVIVGSPTSTSTVGKGTSTSTPSALAVTSASLSASPSSFTGDCSSGVNITISGSISADRSGTVKYHFNRSTGSNSGTHSLTYSSADSQDVSETLTIKSSGSYWDRIYIDDPNHQYFGKASFKVTCTDATATRVPTTVVPTAVPTTVVPTTVVSTTEVPVIPSDTPETPTSTPVTPTVVDTVSGG